MQPKVVHLTIPPRPVWAALLLTTGILACLAGLLVPFPVGCNVLPPYQGCPADPVSWWSTFWPNILAFGTGLVMVAWGLGIRNAWRLPMGSIGGALIVDGLVFNFPSLIVGWFQRWKDLPYYFTTCTANGCPPLTTGQWWNLWWPGIVAGGVGIGCVITGGVLLLISKRPLKKRVWIPVAILICATSAFLLTVQLENGVSFLAGL